MAAMQARNFKKRIQELNNRENHQRKVSEYSDSLEQIYTRIAALEKTEQRMMSDLQLTIKEHNTLIA